MRSNDFNSKEDTREVQDKKPNHKKAILMKQVLMKTNHLISMKQILMKINLELYLNHFRKMNKREF